MGIVSECLSADETCTRELIKYIAYVNHIVNPTYWVIVSGSSMQFTEEHAATIAGVLKLLLYAIKAKSGDSKVELQNALSNMGLAKLVP